MSACEKCWSDAHRGDGDVSGNYSRLIDERKAAGEVCTPEQQAGPDATDCRACGRRTRHQHTGECMACGFGRFRVVPVAPVGTRTAQGFACGPDGCVNEWQTPEWPPSPRGESLRLARVGSGDGPHLSLRMVAKACGLTGEEYSGLEMGRRVGESESDWRGVEATVASLASCREIARWPGEPICAIHDADDPPRGPCRFKPEGR